MDLYVFVQAMFSSFLTFDYRYLKCIESKLLNDVKIPLQNVQAHLLLMSNDVDAFNF